MSVDEERSVGRARFRSDPRVLGAKDVPRSHAWRHLLGCRLLVDLRDHQRCSGPHEARRLSRQLRVEISGPARLGLLLRKHGSGSGAHRHVTHVRLLEHRELPVELEPKSDLACLVGQHRESTVGIDHGRQLVVVELVVEQERIAVRSLDLEALLGCLDRRAGLERQLGDGLTDQRVTHIVAIHELVSNPHLETILAEKLERDVALWYVDHDLHRGLALGSIGLGLLLGRGHRRQRAQNH